MTALTIAPTAAHPDAGILDAWERLMSTFNAAKAADDEVNRRYDAAFAAHTADKPAEPDIDMMLLFGFTLGRCDIARRRLIYVDDLDVLQARIIAAKGVTFWERVDRNPERIAELDKVREFRRLNKESEERYGLKALGDEWETTGERLSHARSALLLAPAPDYSAVRWKLDQLFGPEAVGPLGDEGRGIPCWDAELTDAVIADMARLGDAA